MGFGFFRLVGSPWVVIQPIFWLIVGLVLIVIFVEDLLYMVIPYWLNLFLFSITLGYKVLLVGSSKMQFKDLSLALVSGLVLAGFLVLANKLTKIIKGVDGFGLGDIT